MGIFAFSDYCHRRDDRHQKRCFLSDECREGKKDSIVSENYIGLPLHQLPFLRLIGRLILQSPNDEVAIAEKEAGVINRAF